MLDRDSEVRQADSDTHINNLISSIDQKLLKKFNKHSLALWHYEGYFRIFMIELQANGERPELILEIFQAYANARLIRPGQLEKEMELFARKSPIFNPHTPSDQVIDAGPYKGEAYAISTTDPKKYVQLLTYANLVFNLFESISPGVVEGVQMMAELRAKHEFQHAQAFVNDPEADVRYSAVFYRDKKTSNGILYPAIRVFGKYKVGSFRNCYGIVKNASPLDRVILDRKK